MMRQRDFFTTLFSAALFLATLTGPASADLATKQYVDDFYNMNGPNRGYLFMREMDTDNFFNGSKESGEIRLVSQVDPGLGDPGRTPDLSAYKIGTTAGNGTGTNFYFQTFCVAFDMDSYAGSSSNGQLNYEYHGNVSQTNTHNYNQLTLGVAYLYKEFAAGTLNVYGYDYTNGDGRIASAVMLQEAIWYLMGMGTTGQDRAGYLAQMTSNTDWSNNDNIFLNHLRSLNGNLGTWTAIYDPTNNYSGLMGDSKVFVMNTEVFTRGGGNPTQDVLYVTRGGGNVPEPATFLLWTLGSLGAAGVAYRKRRK